MTTQTAGTARPTAPPAAGPAPRAPARAWPDIPDDGSDLSGLAATVVPHTHWDREWYLPFEQMRLRMARVVDELIEVLERDRSFDAFTLDGQAVLLEDYEAARPANAARLRRLIADGRVAVGPSYVLPDELLASGEALVRNLLIGGEVCRAWGGRPMGVGYYPDTFGHVAQLPQVLAGFGLDAFVFWRGLGDEGERLGAVFEWRAPDGTPVVAIRQLGSYGNANELGRWSGDGRSHHDAPDDAPGVAADRFGRFVRTYGHLLRRSGIPELLLCHGSDHMPIQPDLPRLLDAVRERHPGLDVRIGTYEEYLERIRPHLGGLAVHEGELVSGRDAPILRGIDSTRLELKARSADVERALTIAETLASLARLRGTMPPPTAELGRAWREVLRNLPHDSISGCSVDEVHRDMAARWDAAEELADRISREALAALAGRVEPWDHRPAATPARSVVNPLPWHRRVVSEIPLPGSLAGGRVRLSAVAVGEEEPLPVQRGTGSGGEPVALVPLELDGFGARTVELRLAGRSDAVLEPADPVTVPEPGVLDDGRTRLAVAADGTFSVLDRASGRRVSGLGALEDVADRGDEYDFCPLEGDEPIGPVGPVRVRTLAAGPVVGALEIERRISVPVALRADRRARSRRTVPLVVRTVLRLAAGADEVAVEITFDDRARDHRLRILFPAPDAGTTVRVEGHFAVIERPARPVPPAGEWAEPPSPTRETSGAVAAGSVAVTGVGLPEYEALERPGGGLELAVTLVRSVGWLSRDDLTTRPGHAGPPIPTPGAQCLGPRRARLAVRVGEPLDDAALVRWSQGVRTGVAIGPAGVRTDGLVGVEGEAMAFSALKPAEDGDGVVLRVWNARRSPAHVAVRGRFEEAAGVRLDEAPSEVRPVAEGPVAPAEIVSLRLRGLAPLVRLDDALEVGAEGGFVLATDEEAADVLGVPWCIAVDDGAAPLVVGPGRRLRPVPGLVRLPGDVSTAALADAWDDALRRRERGLPVRGLAVPGSALVGPDGTVTAAGWLAARLARAASVGVLRPVDRARLAELTVPIVPFGSS